MFSDKDIISLKRQELTSPFKTKSTYPNNIGIYISVGSVVHRSKTQSFYKRHESQREIKNMFPVILWNKCLNVEVCDLYTKVNPLDVTGPRLTTTNHKSRTRRKP